MRPTVFALTLPLTLPLMMAGCAGGGAGERSVAMMADPLITSEDPLTRTAALLVAAEAAPDAQARAPVMERLNALNVAVAGDADDNPLQEWRLAHAPFAGTPYRGRTLGPAYRRARLAPGQTMEIAQVFYAGQRAEMRAQTSGSAIALAVNDPRAQPVCEAQLSPQAMCRWLPLFTERYAITLENRGPSMASVYLVFE